MTADKFTLYVPEDEEKLADWIEKMGDVFGSESAVLKQAVKYYKKENEDKFEELIGEDDNDTEDFV